MGYTAPTRTPYPMKSAEAELRSERVQAPAARAVSGTRMVSTTLSGSTRGRKDRVCGQMGTKSKPLTPGCTMEQGLTLVHLSAQPEPLLTQHTP